MGYCGGKAPNPTYHDLGDHSESIQIDFDPQQVSYTELLGMALRQGDFGGLSFSRQYRSVVFYHTKSQLDIARAMGIKELEPVGTFTRAEDYHQKYYLQQSNMVKELYARYPDSRSFTDSTAVTRANGIAGGHLDAAQLEAVVPKLGVSKATAEAMYKRAGTSRSGCALPQTP